MNDSNSPSYENRPTAPPVTELNQPGRPLTTASEEEDSAVMDLRNPHAPKFYLLKHKLHLVVGKSGCGKSTFMGARTDPTKDAYVVTPSEDRLLDKWTGPAIRFSGDLTNPKQLEDLRLKILGRRYVVMDSLTDFFESRDMNKRADANLVMRTLRNLMHVTGTTFIVIYHARKTASEETSQDNVSGSTRIVEAADVVYEFRAMDDPITGDSFFVCGNTKFAGKRLQQAFRFSVTDTGPVDMATFREKITSDRVDSQLAARYLREHSRIGYEELRVALSTTSSRLDKLLRPFHQAGLIDYVFEETEEGTPVKVVRWIDRNR